MKNYETPILKEEKVEIEDIVAASFDVAGINDKLHGWGKPDKLDSRG